MVVEGATRSVIREAYWRPRRELGLEPDERPTRDEHCPTVAQLAAEHGIAAATVAHILREPDGSEPARTVQMRRTRLSRAERRHAWAQFKAGHTYAAIGCELSVSRQAIYQLILKGDPDVTPTPRCRPTPCRRGHRIERSYRTAPTPAKPAGQWECRDCRREWDEDRTLPPFLAVQHPEVFAALREGTTGMSALERLAIALDVWTLVRRTKRRRQP